MKPSNPPKLCPELQLILDQELTAGNTLREPPYRTNWPQENSVFASLTHRLTIGKTALTNAVRYATNDDIHYGWLDECECKIHHHLLVVGSLMASKP